MLTLFIQYLVHDLGLSYNTLMTTMSGVRWHFDRFLCESSAFDSPAIRNCKAAVRRDPARAPTKLRRALPLTLRMLEWLLERYRPSAITPASYSTRMNNQLLCTALIFAFCCMLRPSEYEKVKDTKHVILAGSIFFECVLPGASRPCLRSANNLADVDLSHVTTVKLDWLSAKNIAVRAGRTIWFTAFDSSSSGINLVSCLFLWAKCAQLGPFDFFLSYRQLCGTRKVLSYLRMTTVVKEAAFHFGFNPDNFSCYSLRVGAASLLRAAGASDGDICLMGRWKSLPSCLIYQEASTQAHDLMLGMLLSRGVFTERDILLAYPHSQSVALQPPAGLPPQIA
jgi:hypothetical protein